MYCLFALVEVLDNSSKVIQVLTNHSKLLYGELFPVVVVVKVVRLDLLELLLLIRLLHVDGIVVETSDVFGCVDDLAGLQIVNGLGRSLPVLTELLEVVDGHQNSGKLCNLAQLLTGSFLLCILQLALLVFDLIRLSLKSINLVV